MEELYDRLDLVVPDRPDVREPRGFIQSLSSENKSFSQAYSSRYFMRHPPLIPLTPLVGRKREVEVLRVLLQEPEVRLLSLIGPGGVGKTRLALQVTMDLCSAFVDGICFVSLASISTSDLVLPTLAEALGLSGGHCSFVQVQAAIGEKHCLLLIDNFEQVADAASQLRALLIMCPHLKMLITSRLALRLLEEHEFLVTPLALPDLTHLSSCEDLSRVPAVSLFLQRTRAICPDFVLSDDNASDIAQICVRLDGLPLALELAAARMKLFSPKSLVARLDHRLSCLTNGTRDAPERQQTLRKTIEWSYFLLSREEQRLFHRLSVFAGSYSLQAIESISSNMSTRDKPLLDIVSSLLNHSLLQREMPLDDEQRFTMLETTREYALECLQKNGEEESIRQAHAEYYLELAQTVERQVRDGERTRWIEWIARDFKNLQAAFNWFLLSRGRRETSEIKKTELPSSLALCLVGMGVYAAQQRRYIWAVRLWGKAKTLHIAHKQFCEFDTNEWLVRLLGVDPCSSQTLEIVRTQLHAQAFTRAWNEGQAMPLEQVLAGSEPRMISTPPDNNPDELTPRQREVLHLLAQGLSSAVIAERLIISLTTVNTHVRTIYNKLGVSSRSAATRYAMEHYFKAMANDLN